MSVVLDPFDTVRGNNIRMVVL